MSLIHKLEYISNLPGGVSQETKDKASIEVIVNHVKTTKKMDEKWPNDEYKSYSPTLEKAIKGETSFKQELDNLVKKYGQPKKFSGGAWIVGKCGYSKFLFSQGTMSTFGGNPDLEKDLELMDEYIERLRPELIKELYED